MQPNRGEQWALGLGILAVVLGGVGVAIGAYACAVPPAPLPGAEPKPLLLRVSLLLLPMYLLFVVLGHLAAIIRRRPTPDFRPTPALWVALSAGCMILSLIVFVMYDQFVQAQATADATWASRRDVLPLSLACGFAGILVSIAACQLAAQARRASPQAPIAADA